jgi:ribosomal-protein-serine acetyltransferase
MEPLLLNLPTSLAGPLVELRAYTNADGAAIWNAIHGSREHLAPWMPWVHDWKEPAEGERYVRHMQAQWIKREDFVFGIWEKSTGALVGACGLHAPDWTTPKLMVGYWIAPACQGKGYVTEAVRLITRFGFEHLKANRLWLSCDVLNVRSASVAPRAGYTQEAYLRNDRVNARNALSDTLIFGMTRGDYLENIKTPLDNPTPRPPLKTGDGANGVPAAGGHENSTGS